MNTFALDIWNDESSQCTFYTVRWEDCDENETDKFLYKFYNIPEHKTSVQRLLYFIEGTIGEDHGPLDEFFNRHENEVKGLPVKGRITIEDSVYHFPQFPLRIYALKVSEEIVILFNGGVKDGETNQTSSLHFQWKEACGFAKKIITALSNGTIIVDEDNRLIKLDDGSQDIYL